MKLKKEIPRLFVQSDPTVLRIMPTLAVEIGFNESVLLLQIDYLKSISNTENKKGRPWTFQSIRNLQVEYFPFWSKNTINRTIESLQKQRIIRCDNFNKLAYDRTRWISINYGKVNRLKSIRVFGLSQNGTRSVQNGTRSVQNGTTIPETPTETPADSIEAKASPTESKKQPSIYPKVVDIFFKGFQRLENTPLSWKGKEKAYGQAVKNIIAQATECTEVKTDEAIYAAIYARAEILYTEIVNEKKSGKRDFLSRQKFTPLTLMSQWNQMTPRNNREGIGEYEISDQRGTMTEEELTAQRILRAS